MLKYIFFLIIPLLVIPAYAVDWDPEERHSYDTTWTRNDAAVPTIGGGVAEFDIIHDGASDAAVLNMSAAVSDTTWVLWFDYTVTEQSASNVFMFGLCDLPQTTDSATAQDCILLRHDVSPTNTLASLDTNGAAPFPTATDASTAFTAVTDTTYYMEINRTAATTYNIGVYSDVDRTVHITGVSGTASAATINLDHVKYMNRIAAGSTDTVTVDNVLVCDGFTNMYACEPRARPDAVDDLTVSEIRGQGVDISWTTPDLNGLTLRGYQINQTTPHSSNVATIVLNDTNSPAVTYSVNPLSGETQYSFRVGVWVLNPLPFGFNASGNVVNTTTLENPVEKFTPGQFNITDVNTDARVFQFEEIAENATATRLNVTFSNTFTDVNCDLRFEFAQNNITYQSIDSIVVDSANNESSFVFGNVGNEIINVYCWDVATLVNGSTLIEQTSIPFVQQFVQFRDGDFGTSGNFGSIDLVSLLIFGTIATIGFNRKNESVGAVFLFMLVFGLSWFGIIQLETALGGIIAVIIMLVVATTRKD